MKRTFLLLSLAIFAGTLGVVWGTQGTGVIKNDASRNIFIPDELMMPLQVKAAYNGRDMFFRYRWPSERPGIYHDMLRFEGGKWMRYGASVPGPQPKGIYEDRVTMLVDDGSVPEFEKYGGYITIGDRMRFFTDEASKEEVQAHPYLGQKKKQKEVGKHLPATRSDVNDWASVVPEDDLAALISFLRGGGGPNDRPQTWVDGELFDGVVTRATFDPAKGRFDELYKGGSGFKDGVPLISESKPGDQDYNGGRWHLNLLKTGVDPDKYMNAIGVDDLPDLVVRVVAGLGDHALGVGDLPQTTQVVVLILGVVDVKLRLAGVLRVGTAHGGHLT